MPSLRELQVAFFAALESGTAGATRVGDDLRAVVASGTGRDVAGRTEHRRGALDADGKIGVYVQMYWMRIVDVLREDFPRTATLVGDDRFRTLARDYLAATPSRHPSLRHVGAGFADFVAARLPAAAPAFLADLARLERARVDVFDAPDADVLTIADVRRVAIENWGDLRLRPIPALRVLELAWPVHTVWPDDATVTTLAPAATTLRVWRDEYRVFQAPMDASECGALALLLRGATNDGQDGTGGALTDGPVQDGAEGNVATPPATSPDATLATGARFAEICAVVAAAVPPEEAATQAAALLLRWIEDRLLAAPAS